jgi:DNA-binding response OmpR family regulator
MDEIKKQKKILMVEDDIFLRKLYRDQLTRKGFQFTEAINGEEGTNKIISEHPDLVLLDLMLPLKNGFDVLKEIKHNKDTENIPVIIISNLGQESDIKEGLNLGAEDYFVKTEMRLSDIIDRIVSRLSNN